jgi:hypothetical protein
MLSFFYVGDQYIWNKVIQRKVQAGEVSDSMEALQASVRALAFVWSRRETVEGL